MARLVSLLFIAWLVTGCFSSSKRSVERGHSWALAGGPLFVSFVDEKTTKTTAFTFPKNDHNEAWRTTTGTETMRTWPIAVDPVTGRATQLAWAHGALSPFYWDGQRQILWVSDPDDASVIGLGAHGTEYAGGDSWATFVRSRELPPWFVIARISGRVRLWNLASGGEVVLEEARWGKVYLEGSLMRVVVLKEVATGVHVFQTRIDWSNPAAPVRLADFSWQTPHLPGVRRAYAMSASGRRFVEVVDLADGQRLIGYDLNDGEMHGSPVALGDRPQLHQLGGERIAVVGTDAESKCWYGHVLDAASGKLTALGKAPCVNGTITLAGMSYPLLQLAGDRRGVFDVASGAVVELGEVVAVGSLGPTTIAFGREVEGVHLIEQLDLSTGARSVLARRPGSPSMIHRVGDVLVLAEDGKLLAQRLGNDAVSSLAVPDAPGGGPDGVRRAWERAGIGVRPERTKLWMGASFGTTSKARATVDLDLELRRWWARRLALSVGVGVYGELLGEGRGYSSLRGTLGAYRYLRSGYGGWYAGGELGLGSGVERDDAGSSASLAAAAAASVGYQGRVFELSATALAPSLLEVRSRGVAVMAGLRIGLYGANF